MSSKFRVEVVNTICIPLQRRAHVSKRQSVVVFFTTSRFLPSTPLNIQIYYSRGVAIVNVLTFYNSFRLETTFWPPPNRPIRVSTRFDSNVVLQLDFWWFFGFFSRSVIAEGLKFNCE